MSEAISNGSNTPSEQAENWKFVKGFEGLYSVSDQGRIQSHNRLKGRVLKPRKAAGTGYLIVTLCLNGKKHERHVAHLVLEAHVGPRPAGYHACHSNSCRTDNRLQNLRWDTASANKQDALQARAR